MKARMKFWGTLSEPFDVDGSVKQGDLSDPTLFAIYVNKYAFKDLDEGIYIYSIGLQALSLISADWNMILMYLCLLSKTCFRPMSVI